MAKLKILNIPFTQVPNVVLYDKNISLRAKGLFAYLCSKPNGWEFANKRIAKESKDGEDSVLAGLKELEENGYLIRNKLKTGKVDYVLQTGEKPDREIPSQGNSLTGKFPSISNKELTTNTDLLNNKEFAWEKSLEKMEQNAGSDMDIIATFLVEKKITPKTSEELTGYIKRYRKIAKDIQPFVGMKMAKFWKAVELCNEESRRVGYDWGLETIYKKITKI